MANYIEELDQLAAQNEGGPENTGSRTSGVDWNLTFEDPNAPGGRRVSRYNIPASNVDELYNTEFNFLREQDQALPLVNYEMAPSAINFNAPGQINQPLDLSNAVRTGANIYSGGGIGSTAVTPQGTTTATAGTAPGTSEERAPRQRGGVTWPAPEETVEFTQEDFYPNPQDPAQYNYSTGLEVVARPGRMPMGAISKAATILNNRQVELDKKRQAFAAEFSKVPKTADPYQQNFTRLVQDRNNEFVQGIADAMYGGNVNKAYRAIATNPELQARWRDMNAKNEALASHGLYNFKRAEDYLTQAATNKIASTPEARQLAKDILYGMGRYAGGGGVGGNFDKLVNDMTQFDMMLGRDEYFKTTIAPSVKDFAERQFLQPGKTPGMVVKDGRYMFVTKGHRETFENQINQLARSMALEQGYGAGDNLDQKIADNKKFLSNMLPDKFDMTTTVEDMYKGGGGADGEATGGGAGTGAGGLGGTTIRYQPLNPIVAATDEDGKTSTQLSPLVKEAQRKGAKITSDLSRSYSIDAIQFFEVSNKKARIPAAQSIQGEAIIPVGVFRDKDNKIFMYGKKARYAGAAAQSPDDIIGGLYDDSGNINITKFNNLEDSVVPYNMARAAISVASGIESEQDASNAIDQFRSQLGLPIGATAQAQQQSAATASQQTQPRIPGMPSNPFEAPMGPVPPEQMERMSLDIALEQQRNQAIREIETSGTAIDVNSQPEVSSMFSSLESKYELPSGLLNAVMMQESRGRPGLTSRTGAQGYFQFMPDTASQYNVEINNIESEAEGAAKMLSDLLKENDGDLDKALASYNWGIGNVKRKGMENMPEETRNYIPGVKKRMPLIFGGQGESVEQTQITAEEFNRKWSELPSGGKLVGPNGKEYTKK
ncbi:MAG: lytic transglycosylase domain-containing protein [Pseudomonadota bacterium]